MSLSSPSGARICNTAGNCGYRYEHVGMGLVNPAYGQYVFPVGTATPMYSPPPPPDGPMKVPLVRERANSQTARRRHVRVRTQEKYLRSACAVPEDVAQRGRGRWGEGGRGGGRGGEGGREGGGGEGGLWLWLWLCFSAGSVRVNRPAP